MEESQFVVITESSRKKHGYKKRSSENSIGPDLFENLYAGCDNVNINSSSTLPEIMEETNKEPCVSAVAFLTYLYEIEQYPCPNTIDEQENLLTEVQETWEEPQIEMEWTEVLILEEEKIEDMCSISDIDYEFVIDSSGSIELTNWQITMNQIADYWIKVYKNLL